MSNPTKTAFLAELRQRFGKIRKIDASLSLYEVSNGAATVYIRYSRLHERGRTFYGLRESDLRALEGRPAVVCFLWDDQQEPLFVPFSEYEAIIHAGEPASDGQYKVQVLVKEDGCQLYIARMGKFSVEGYFGWEVLKQVVGDSQVSAIPDLTHPQVQTLLGSIGSAKGFDIWIPPVDRARLDWSLGRRFACREEIPVAPNDVRDVLKEVDVIWIPKGSSELRNLFEIEHSTPVYSGLLRFNDIRLAWPTMHPSFNVVANDARRDLFVRQLNRPTFRSSGLAECCTFLEYEDVFKWYKRATRATEINTDGRKN